jgi:hypothetical protein
MFTSRCRLVRYNRRKLLLSLLERRFISSINLSRSSAVFREGYAYGLAYEGPYIGFSPNEENAVLQLGVKYTECVG